MRRASTNRAFTLVELLVVIAIISLLIAIILPTLGKAREAANRAACLSNLRQLATAVNGYLVENRSHFPDAGAMNSYFSGYSPRATGLAPWSPLPVAYGQDAYVLPCVAQLLARWTGNGPKLWTCPSAIGRYDVVMTGNAFAGATSADEFKPNYLYMGGKEHLFYINTSPTIATEYRMKDWAVRSLSGLSTSTSRSVRRDDASRVVVFFDLKGHFHTRAGKDVYDLEDGEKGNYFSNYAFLDGHAEGKPYRDMAEYFTQVHSPIRQKWFGTDFTSTFSAYYP